MTADAEVANLRARGARRLRGSSLRSRWNRLSAVVLVSIVVMGAAFAVNQRGAFASIDKRTADVQYDSTLLNNLEQQFGVYEGYVHRYLDGEADPDRLSARAVLVADFERGIHGLHAVEAQHDLQQAYGLWWANDGARRPLVDSITEAARFEQHAAVTVADNQVIALVQRSSSITTAELTSIRAAATKAAGAASAATGAVVGALVGLLLMVRRRLSIDVLGPLERLSSGADRLAAGDLHHRVDVDRTDELGELAKDFNRMAASIEASQTALHEAATHDQLTGLLNRGAALAALSQELARANRLASSVLCLFVDLDGLKTLNDEYGHDVGDDAIRRTADVLRGCTRSSDIVARLGGDEFLVAVGAIVEPAEGEELAVRICQALSNQRIVARAAKSVSISCSIGVAPARPEDTVDSLVHNADEALYLAKKRGRNQVAVAS